MNKLKVYELIVGKKHEVVLSMNKDIALYWVRDKLGLSKDQMASIKVFEIPNEKIFNIKDYGKATIKELIDLSFREDRFSRIPMILCWKNPMMTFMKVTSPNSIYLPESVDEVICSTKIG